MKMPNILIKASFSFKKKYAAIVKKRKERAARDGQAVETSKFFKANVKQIKFNAQKKSPEINLQLSIVLRGVFSSALSLINKFPRVENNAAIIIRIIEYLFIKIYLIFLKHLA